MGPGLRRGGYVDLIQPIELQRGVVEHRVLLVIGVALRDTLECVPQIGIAAHSLVDREIAFEHGLVGAERLDTGVQIGSPGLGELLGGRRLGLLADLEAHQRRHAEAAELHVDIGELAELLDLPAPFLEDFLGLAGVRADRERTADMVDDDLGLREGSGEADDVAELRVEGPGLEAEVQRRQRREALTEAAVEVEAFAGAGGEHAQRGIAVPGRAVADTAEAPARGDDMLLQNALGAAADRTQIDIADDPGAVLGRAVFAAFAHRRYAGDKGRLAERTGLRRAVGAVHLAAFEKDRGADVVAAGGVFDQVVQQIAVARAVPQMVVRVDNRPIGLERLFLGGSEPVLADRQVALRRGARRLHEVPPNGLKLSPWRTGSGLTDPA